MMAQAMWQLALKHAAAFRRDEAGATAIEYGLMTFFLALAVVAAVGATGNGVKLLLDAAAAAFPTQAN